MAYNISTFHSLRRPVDQTNPAKGPNCNDPIDLICISKPQILFISQILKSMFLAFLLVQNQYISASILTPKNDIEDYRYGNQNSVTANDALPYARVVLANLLGANPKWTDDVACRIESQLMASFSSKIASHRFPHQHNT